MVKKVYLTLNEILLGYLVVNDGQYVFCADKEGISIATQKNPIKMKMFRLNRSGFGYYDAIPAHYCEYLSQIRENLAKDCGIDEKDGDFDKLYKLSSLKLNTINFGITQG